MKGCYRYWIEYRVKGRFAKEWTTGGISLKKLEDVSDFIERTKRKYDKCEFQKYDNGVLVSSF